MWSNNGPQVPDTHNAGVEKIIIRIFAQTIDFEDFINFTHQTGD